MTTGDEDVEAFAVLSLSRYNTVPNNKIKIMGNAKMFVLSFKHVLHISLHDLSYFNLYCNN